MNAAGFKWDGGASSDPIATLHSAIENARFEPRAMILSPRQFQCYELACLIYESGASYRVRHTAWALLRLEARRYTQKSKIFPWGAAGPVPNAERVFAKALALEAKA